jgi:hypothetical protein
MGVTRLLHPAYSPDLAPLDFAIFGDLKRILQGMTFQSVDDLELQVKIYMLSIDKERRKDIFEDWKRRLDLCVRSDGDFVE